MSAHAAVPTAAIDKEMQPANLHSITDTILCVCVLFLYFSVLSSPLSLSAKFVSSITEVMREWQAQPNVRQIKPTQRAFGTHCNIVILTYLMFSGSVLTSESSVVK